MVKGEFTTLITKMLLGNDLIKQQINFNFFFNFFKFQLSDGLVIFPRSSRSLYDAGAEGSSVLRSQRGILQQEQPLIIIDADDGQLMRYGR